MKHRNFLALGALVLAAAGGNATFAAEPAPLTMVYELSIGADGRVAQMKAFPAVESRLALALEKEVRRWEFQPAQSEGRTEPTLTYLRLAVVPQAGGVEPFRLLSATTGPAILSMSSPGYPPAALRRGEGGVVVLKLKVDKRGVVRGVASTTSPGAPRELAAAAESVARSWRFLPEQIAGQPVGSEVLMPVCFQTGNPDPSACDWQAPSGERFSSSSIGVAIQPAARIKTELAFASN